MDRVDSDYNLEIDLLENVHIGLLDPTDNGQTYLVRGNYKYYHYGCDSIKDRVNELFKHIFIIDRSCFTRFRDGAVDIGHYRPCALGCKVVLTTVRKFRRYIRYRKYW